MVSMITSCESFRFLPSDVPFLKSLYFPLDFSHFFDQSLLCGVVDELDVRPVVTNVQTGMRQFQILLLITYGLFSRLDALFQLIDHEVNLSERR